MAKEFRELRERLLRAGVAPRHVRRYLTELNEHKADLTAEEERAGRSREEAEAAALARLGSVETLARTMIERRELRSWTARAPWAVLGVGPVAALACGWAAALAILWSGWMWFDAGAATPLGARPQGAAVVYFGVGRMLYFFAPVLAGWGMAVLAGRQRLRAWWPVVVLALLAWMGATGLVQVSPPEAGAAAGHVSLNFVAGVESQGVAAAAMHALVLFGVMALPYLAGRWSTGRRDLAQA